MNYERCFICSQQGRFEDLWDVKRNCFLCDKPYCFHHSMNPNKCLGKNSYQDCQLLDHTGTTFFLRLPAHCICLICGIRPSISLKTDSDMDHIREAIALEDH